MCFDSAGGAAPTESELMFFDGFPTLLDDYALLLCRLRERHPDVCAAVSKTQISLRNRRVFAVVSLPNGKLHNRERLLLSIGLPYRPTSPRVLAATEPYPKRWTNHVLLDALDGELLGWLEEAYQFAMHK